MRDWNTVKLGDIASLITSGSRGWGGYYAESGAKFIRMTNLPRVGISLRLDDLKYVQLPANHSEGSRTLLQEGDVLVSITAELGKIGYVPNGLGEAYINQHVSLIRFDKDKVVPKMIAYILSTTSTRNALNRRNDSGAKAGLNLTTIQKFPIQIPDVNEQSRIVEILETWDEYLEKLDMLIELKSNLKKGLMQRYFSPEDTNIKVEKVNLGSVISKFTTGLNPRDNFKLGSGANYYVTIKNITNGSLKLDTCELVDDKALKLIAKRSQLETGDVIMASIGNVGDSYLLESPPQNWNINESVFNLKPETAKILPKYLYYTLTSHSAKRFFDNNATGSSFKSIKMKDLREMTILLPTLNIQQEVVLVLTNIDDQIKALKVKREMLDDQKRYLLNHLLSGEIRTPVTLHSAEKESQYA